MDAEEFDMSDEDEEYIETDTKEGAGGNREVTKEEPDDE